MQGKQHRRRELEQEEKRDGQGAGVQIPRALELGVHRSRPTPRKWRLRERSSNLPKVTQSSML